MNTFTGPEPGLDWGGVLLTRKWTFSRAFWEKVDFIASVLGNKRTFSRAFLEKVDFFMCSSHVGGKFPGKIVKIMIENYAPPWLQT